jgi:hypothetical protein
LSSCQNLFELPEAPPPVNQPPILTASAANRERNKYHSVVLGNVIQGPGSAFYEAAIWFYSVLRFFLVKTIFLFAF